MKRLIVSIVMSIMISCVEAAQLVVIASNSSSFKPGQIIDGSEPINLEQGGFLALVSEKGETIKLQGPYQGQPDPEQGVEQGTVIDSLSRIISEPEQSATLAVFRSTSKKQNVWSINIDKAGQYCVIDKNSFELWRRKPLDSGTLEIKNTHNSSSVQVAWNEGEKSAPWPGNMEIRDQAQFQFSFAGEEPVKITIRIVPDDLATDVHRIIWLSDEGCSKQANRLLRNL